MAGNTEANKPHWGVERNGRVYLRWLTLSEAAAMVLFEKGEAKIVWLDPETRSYEAL